MNIHAWHHTLKPLLRPFSLPYSLFMKARRDAYNDGALPRFCPRCPCVSIGNIAWGGTGKTPFTAWFLEWARENSVRTTVLSRGYGGKPGKHPLTVLPDTPARVSGDEPLMLARSHPEASIVVCPRRPYAAEYAELQHAPELFLLDDGMQHLAMMRHADIVLLRPEDVGQEWNRVIPAGSWREGETALHSATAFAIKTSPELFRRAMLRIEKRLGAYHAPVFSFVTSPSALYSLYNPDVIIAETEYKKPYALVSAIGNPAQLQDDIASFTGRQPEFHMKYADHHAYSEKDIHEMRSKAKNLPLICTEKDAVKLASFSPLLQGHPVWVLQSKVIFGPTLFTPKTFPEWWQEWWNTRNDKVIY